MVMLNEGGAEMVFIGELDGSTRVAIQMCHASSSARYNSVFFSHADRAIAQLHVRYQHCNYQPAS
jgi:hypothetical protein